MGKQKTSSTSKTNSNPSSSAPTLESHKPSAPRRKANVVKSGNAGSSKAALEAKAAAAANPSPAATLFGPNWTGKTPLSLLHEHCQRRSWDKPVIDARKLPGAQTFSGIVILKRKDDSVLLKPQDEVPIVCDTALEARHKAAVYGLFRFANGLNLKMTLPPSMRDYWSQLEQFKKSSTPKGMDWWWAADPFAAKPKPQPIAGHSGGGGQAGVSSNGSGPAQSRGKSGTSNDFDSTPVFRLPSHLQEQADTLLRKRMARSSVNSPSASGTATPISLQITDDQMSSVSSHLQRLGFGPSHVQSACHWLENSASSSSDKFIQTLLATRPLKDAALTYLQITLANAQLPPAFQSKSEDASIRLGGAKDAESLSLNWKARTVHDQTGFPLDATEQRMQAANGNEGLALDLLLRDLAGRFEEAQLLLSQSSKTSEQETESKQIWNEEVEALESIYAERFKQVHNAQSESFELTFPEHADVKLYAVRHSASSYPCVDGGIPTCVVQSDGLPPFLRLALSRSLFERMRQDDAKDMAEAGQGGLLCESLVSTRYVAVSHHLLVQL